MALVMMGVLALAACRTEGTKTPPPNAGADGASGAAPSSAAQLDSTDEMAPDTLAADTGEAGRVLFRHDFEGTATGSFPSRLDYIAGNMEAVVMDRDAITQQGSSRGQRHDRERPRRQRLLLDSAPRDAPGALHAGVPRDDDGSQRAR